MKLIDKQAVFKYFAAPEPEDLAAWCEKKGFNGVDPLQNRYTVDHIDMPSDHVLAAALWHAATRYPDAERLDVCSFAGLVAYLATGWYGGFGTEHYTKERQAENIVLALAGGMAAPPGGMIATVPEKVVNGTPTADFTHQVLKFLEAFYFGDQGQAVANLLAEIDSFTAARIVLGMARTQAEYNRLAKVADKFLKKKENISALRKAVRDVLN